MATVRHAKVSSVPDGPDATAIRPSDWNAEHVIEGADLAQVTGTNAATTMLPDSMYALDGAILTADRNYTLPASADCVVGETRVGLMLTAGNASFEAILRGNTSQTINGGAAASEWSRLFITGEVVILRYVASNKWVVEYDGRIPQTAVMRLSTAASGEVANTLTQPTSKGGAWTADVDNASITTVASDRITSRRVGNYSITVLAQTTNAVSSGQTFLVQITKNGTTSIVEFFRGASGSSRLSFALNIPLAADDFLVYSYLSSEGGRGLNAFAAPRLSTSFSLAEIL